MVASFWLSKQMIYWPSCSMRAIHLVAAAWWCVMGIFSYHELKLDVVGYRDEILQQHDIPFTRTRWYSFSLQKDKAGQHAAGECDGLTVKKECHCTAMISCLAQYLPSWTRRWENETTFTGSVGENVSNISPIL